MREFNLEEAKAGKPVCTRDGREARIICFDAKAKEQIVALVTTGRKKQETSFSYNVNGRYFGDLQEDDIDLMMKI